MQQIDVIFIAQKFVFFFQIDVHFIGLGALFLLIQMMLKAIFNAHPIATNERARWHVKKKLNIQQQHKLIYSLTGTYTNDDSTLCGKKNVLDKNIWFSMQWEKKVNQSNDISASTRCKRQIENTTIIFHWKCRSLVLHKLIACDRWKKNMNRIHSPVHIDYSAIWVLPCILRQIVHVCIEYQSPKQQPLPSLTPSLQIIQQFYAMTENLLHFSIECNSIWFRSINITDASM